MPTYSYACVACAHRFDAFQSIHDDALSVCPDCGGHVRRVISAVGVSFKGSGFYRTDSRSSGSSSIPGSSSGSNSSAGSSSKSSSESVPSAPSKPAATSAAADPS